MGCSLHYIRLQVGRPAAPCKEIADAPGGESGGRPALAAAHGIAMPHTAAPAAASTHVSTHADAHRTAPRAARRAALPCTVPPCTVPSGGVPSGGSAPTATPGSAPPLPVGWRSATDERGRLYYYERSTKHTQWHHPGGTIGSLSLSPSLSPSPSLSLSLSLSLSPTLTLTRWHHW